MPYMEHLGIKLNTSKDYVCKRLCVFGHFATRSWSNHEQHQIPSCHLLHRQVLCSHAQRGVVDSFHLTGATCGSDTDIENG